MFNSLLNILKEIVNNIEVKISDIVILGKEEKQKLLVEFNNTSLEYKKEKTIQELFEEQVEKTPNNIAVTFEDKVLTYKELNEKANSLARALRENGVGPDVIVGIMVERSLEMIVGIMAILKAGGAYLPIDPEYPEDRTKYMLENSKAVLLLTEPKLIENKDILCKILNITDCSLFDNSIANINNISSANNLAYVIYTSGSTGKPKGVMIEHRQVNNFIEGIKEKLTIENYSSILCITTISFDIFVLETLLPLTNGLKVSITGSGEDINGEKLSEIIEKNNIEIMQTTPSRLKLLLKNEVFIKSMEKIKVMLVGGEALPKTLVEDLRKYNNLKIYNMHGPTETTVWSLIKTITDSNNILIGKPISNTKIYIVDKFNNLLPVGVAGELCISGDGLARGYLYNEELTTEKFVINPYEAGEKMYKTGDLARWLSDGNIEFLGRIDHQVKIRGFRIELGEIESNILKVQGVKEVIVLDKRERWS